MADNLTVLYWDTVNNRWHQLKQREENPGFDSNYATTPTNKPYIYSGGNPVNMCRINDKVGAPLEMELSLQNRQAKPRSTFTEPNNNYVFGEDPLVNPQLGQFHNLLNEDTEIIVHETNTMMTLFVGKVYTSDEKYDISRGSELLLTCRDALEILDMNTISGLTRQEAYIRQTADTTISNDDVSNGGPLRFARNSLDIIRYVSEYAGGGDFIEIPNITGTRVVTSDKIDHTPGGTTPSYPLYDAEYINRRKRELDSGSYAYVNFNEYKESPLRIIQKLAEQQQWYNSAADNRKQFGWTFHLDATRSTPVYTGAESTIKPKQDFVYYRRGYNATTEPLTKGFMVKYATQQLNEPSSAGVDDRIRNMFQDGFEFKGFGTESFTHIELSYVADKLKQADLQVDGGANDLEWVASTTSGPVGGNQINNSDQTSFPGVEDIRNYAKFPKWGGTYDLYEALDVQNQVREKDHWTTEVFAIIYVKPFSGNDVDLFSVHSNDTDTALATPERPANNPKRRSFEQVSSLHTKSKASNEQAFITRTGSNTPNCTQTWLGNVQRQGTDEDGNHFIILSKPQHELLKTLDEDDVLYERSHYYDNTAISQNPRPDQAAKVKLAADGYPARRMGRKTKKMGEQSTFAHTTYEELRNLVENNFLKANNKLAKRMRKGLFSLKDYPHVRWGGTCNAGTQGMTIALDAGMNISSGVTPSVPYGIRKGCSVVKSYNGNNSSPADTELVGGDRFVGYVSSTTVNTVGTQIYKASSIDGSAQVGTWNIGDKYNIYVPYRAGMTLRCENLISGVNGDFIITEINYSWNNGRVGSEIEVIGINDEVVFKGRNSLQNTNEYPRLYDAEDERIVDAATLAANAYTTTGVYWWHDHELWETPNIAPASKRDYNTFSWSGGQVRLNSNGDLFKFLAGDTDAALTAAGYTVTSGEWGDGTQNNPMQPYKQYVIYIDTAEEPNEYGYYTVRIGINDYSDFGYVRNNTFLELAYITTGVDRDLGPKTIGLPGANFYQATIDFENGMCEVQFMAAFSNVWGLSNSLLSAETAIQPNSITSAILRKGAKPFATNLTWEAYNNTYNNVQWHDGNDGPATISFGDPGTGSNITVAAGNSVGSGAGDSAFSFSAGTTYFAYMTPDTDSKPHFSTAVADATNDDAFIVAIITIDTDATQKSPTILPINSKVPTLSAVAIATDALVARHIQAGAIATNKLTVEAQGEISEKTKTHVGGSAPSWTPRTYDIWFDTDPQPTVIKVYDGSNWVVRNSNAPEGTGVTVFHHSDYPESSPPESNAVNDVWYAWDTDVVYIAVTHPANSIETSTEWVKQDVVTAINSATTEIKGGLINTAKIILTANGGNILEEGVGTSPNAARIELGNTEIAGYSSSGENDKEFYMSASTGKGYFADGAVIVDSSGLTITAANNSFNFLQFSKTNEALSNAAFMYRYVSGSTDELHFGKIQGYPIRTIGHLLPSSNNLSNLGSSTDKFLYVYGSNINGVEVQWSLRSRANFGQQAAPSYSFNSQTQIGMYATTTTLNFAVLSKQVLKLVNTSNSSGDFHFTNSIGTSKIYGYTASGNMYVTGDLWIGGSVTKASGSFMIDHPLDDDKYLIHGFVEAPRYDLIYRGKATLSSGTATADIDTDSNMSDGTYVALTKNSQVWVQNKTGWAAVKGSVQGNQVVITCQDDTSTDEIDWLVVAERNDAFVKSDLDKNTNAEGTFIPEQLKVERDIQLEIPPEPDLEEE